MLPYFYREKTFFKSVSPDNSAVGTALLNEIYIYLEKFEKNLDKGL